MRRKKKPCNDAHLPTIRIESEREKAACNVATVVS